LDKSPVKGDAPLKKKDLLLFGRLLGAQHALCDLNFTQMTVDVHHTRSHQYAPNRQIIKGADIFGVGRFLTFGESRQASFGICHPIKLVLADFTETCRNRLTYCVSIGQYISQAGCAGDFVGLLQRDANSTAQWSEMLPIYPTVAVSIFAFSTDPGLKEMILSSRRVPNGIP